LTLQNEQHTFDGHAHSAFATSIPRILTDADLEKNYKIFLRV